MGIEQELESDYKGSSPEKDLDNGSGTPEPFNDESTVATEKLTESTTKIKFCPSNNFDSKNGEAQIDIKPYKPKVVGLDKAEIMDYAKDPFWIRLRLVLFVAFWLIWIAMLIGAIAIVIMTPKCDPKPENDWYQQSTVYFIEPKSFKDSDDDGRGDLKGLIEKAEYLNRLGVGALVLGPIYDATDNNDGYKVKDHTKIDQNIGTLEDFNELVDTMKNYDIKIILDFIPNHSSNEHPWFIKSEKKEDSYTNYYVWKDSKGSDSNGQPIPPNNWLSVNGGSAWKWSNTRRQFYLHQFHESQPDFNLNDLDLQEELKNILKFWLERGVSGFRVDALGYLFEDLGFQDETILDQAGLKRGDYESIEHKYTFGLDKALDLTNNWNELLNSFTASANNSNFDASLPKILVTPTIKGHTGFNNMTRTSYPFNQVLLKLNQDSSATDIVSITNDMLVSQAWPTWDLGGYKDDRLATRLGPKADGLLMLTLLTKGTPLIYFGDEIGMKKLNSPMQWGNTTNAGFSKSTASLPIEDYEVINVENQESLRHSRLKIFRRLVTIRKQNTIQFGETHLNEQSNVIVMVRVLRGNPGFVVAFNVGNNATITDLTKISKYLPELGDLELQSTNILSNSILYGVRSKVLLDSLPLDAGQAVVLSFVPNFSN